MGNHKEERVNALLDELNENIKNVEYWVKQYKYYEPPDSDDNSDALFIMRHYIDVVDGIANTIRGLLNE